MKIRLFAGGYTEPILQGTGEIVEGRCKGISTYAFDTDTGRLQAVLAPRPTPNPSCIIVSPDGRYLYCANELKNYHEVDGSTISAFAIEAQSGQLRRLNTQATCGEDACHLTLSPDGAFSAGGELFRWKFLHVSSSRGWYTSACRLCYLACGQRIGSTSSVLTTSTSGIACAGQEAYLCR